METDGRGRDMTQDWLDRWDKGRTGWHETNGNAGLKAHWIGAAGRVLVPLCGKSPDLAWLADRGHQVVGVELAEKAIVDFFEEQHLAFDRADAGPMTRFEAKDADITIFCGDYFQLTDQSFDALYDRGALVAVDPSIRSRYVEHTKSLLAENSMRLIVTLEYDQAVTPGPPFSVQAAEMIDFWPDLVRIAEHDDIDNCPPKFIAAGLQAISEVVWRSG